jgi:hypothetical protein
LQTIKNGKEKQQTLYQWAGKFGITQAQEDYPELNTINSEMECGNGSNTWEYAMYSYEMMHHYFKHGTRAAVVMNPFGFEKVINIEGNSYKLAPESFNTILL